MRVGPLIVATLFFAGCGSATKSSTPPTAPATTTPAPAPQPAPADAKKVAAAGLVRLSDMPNGWTLADKPTASGTTGVSRCFLNATRSAIARGKGRQFDPPDAGNREVLSVTSVYASEAAAGAALRREGSEVLRRCVATATIKGSGDVIGDVKTGALRIPAVGDDTAAFRATLIGTGAGAGASGYADFSTVRVGRALATIMVLDAPQPFDQGLRDRLLRASARRLRAAQ